VVKKEHSYYILDKFLEVGKISWKNLDRFLRAHGKVSKTGALIF
jgi:hypothetical protein